MKPNQITSCQLKKSYVTKEAAQKTADYLLTKFIRVRVYKCYCEAYHLTSDKRRS
jgi:hypothetical protein